MHIWELPGSPLPTAALPAAEHVATQSSLTTASHSTGLVFGAGDASSLMPERKL